MDIESLEINLFKASEIKDDDIILVKMDGELKKSLKKEDIKSLYDQIIKITKKNLSIYFFPKDISIDMIKNHVKKIEESKETFLKEEQNEKNN